MSSGLSHLDQTEQLVWSQIQIEYLHGKIQSLQRQVQALLDELEKCGQIIELSPTPQELNEKSEP
jgi:prefoldin subunit 5